MHLGCVKLQHSCNLASMHWQPNCSCTDRTAMEGPDSQRAKLKADELPWLYVFNVSWYILECELPCGLAHNDILTIQVHDSMVQATAPSILDALDSLILAQNEVRQHFLLKIIVINLYV